APKRINWQVFLTPTVSYRALSSNKDFSGDNNNGSPFPFERLDDVNKAVTHKPDLGFQIGINGRYPITKSINMRAGLHLNVNKYDIKAFYYPEVAIINL